MSLSDGSQQRAPAMGHDRVSPLGQEPEHRTVSAMIHVEEVGDGIFAFIQRDGSWYLNNAGIIPERKLSYFVDSAATVSRTKVIIEEARRLGVGDRVGMIATHHHGDHTNGNATIDPTFIVAHASVPAEMAQGFAVPPPGLFNDVDWGEIVVRQPDVVFERELDLQIGERLVRVLHFGRPAHTLGDAVVYFPQDHVLFAGDLAFNGGTPFALMGSVQGWLDTLVALRALEVTVVVPGHGDPCGMDVFDGIERYLRFVLELAGNALREGVSPLEAALNTDLGDFAQWHDSERIVGNLHRAMAELSGASPGSPINIQTAFVDMLKYNGGPLRCFA
ncbi:MBL fold metallo-hydrolase [Ferrimicrobium sp.]|uniref:MBL fold metallo-hydrolase n=1 Tax=Ferrimicrobium sp. TaxID=2926050 RepID=UPI00261D8A1A|nr:MBL fold metallo-hydrolase [Ferrimicrobium sp.]